MIDERSGDILFDDGNIIGPSVSLDAFCDSAFGQEASVLLDQSSYKSFSLGIRSLGGCRWSVTLYFRDDRLLRVDIAASDPSFGTSWGDWSKEKEMCRKRRHDEWVAQTLSRADFHWGKVLSVYDERAGGSYISIRYDI